MSLFSEIFDRFHNIALKFFFSMVNFFKRLMEIGNGYINSVVDVEEDESFENPNEMHGSLLTTREDVENDYIVLDSKKN